MRVVTAADLEGKVGGLPYVARIKGVKATAKFPLARGKVKFVGEPVTAVVAESRYAAADALELVEAEYEPLTPVVDPREALKPSSPAVNEELGGNVAYRWTAQGGDVDGAFARAHELVRAEFRIQRVAPVALEPRGVAARYEPGSGFLTVWSSTQIPHLVKTFLAEVLGHPENRLRVVAPEVGGGFGSKLNLYAEEVVVAFLARELRRPVKWVEGRSENLVATTHGRDQWATVEAAVARDGELLGLKARIVADLGAYLQLFTAGLPVSTARMLPGPYRVRHVALEVEAAYTNKMATDAYRGAGRPEATYLMERLVDRVARRLRLDPARVRERNLLAPEEFPYRSATGLTYDTGNYSEALKRALEVSGYWRLREEQKSPQDPERRGLRGVGLASYVEICGMGPSRDMPLGGWEHATVRVEPSGSVTVLTGVSPHGQGSETTLAQIAAATLGVPLEAVEVVHGDTAAVPHGVGTYGSRSVAVGGNAVLEAAARVRRKALGIAAHLLEARPEDLDLEDGRVFVRGSPSRGLDLKTVARAAYQAGRLPEGVEPGLEATVLFEPQGFTFPFGAHVAVVEVDPETGEVRLLRYVAVDDCGRVVNPLLAEGQVHGGALQGISQALLEDLRYDQHGQPLTTTLLDYLLPTAAEAPRRLEARMMETRALNPLGAKGLGEAATIASIAAVMNAVEDALAPLGVEVDAMPATPEALWRLLKGGWARRGASGG